MKSILKKIGPGLLYAGAAIGVSHLVQSTRAGAEYSFSLIIFIIIANIIKYPFFKIGAIYPLISDNKSLVDGYRKVGKYAITLLIVQTLLTMIIVVAAISLVTSAIIPHLLNIQVSIKHVQQFYY
jgi:Mn2+/Fe2+ NRAMP family transporter